ncbi:MAG: NlpC/P60 family protein [Deltaproteobacteria bacterium]|nr:NlpC/P60 family protein [Deltaproteobacteria bacterium]
MHTHTWRVWRNMALLLVCAVLLTACGAFRSAPDTGPAPESARKAVKTAYTQMGKKYRSGGASPQKGFDCSGLIWWAYRVNGVKVPRITTDQAHAGQQVPLSAVRQGDILVFRTGSGPRGLHTGIYTGGNAFIHSPRQGEKVRVESLEVPYWRNKLITVRRVVY